MSKKIYIASIFIISFFATIAVACTKHDMRQELIEETIKDIIEKTQPCDSYNINFVIDSTINNKNNYLEGSYNISEKNNIRSVIGYLAINDNRRNYKEYLDFNLGKRYFYNIKESKWEISDTIKNNGSILDIISYTSSLTESEENYILSGTVPYNTFHESVKITNYVDDKKHSFVLPFTVYIDREDFNVNQMTIGIKESIVEDDIIVKKFSVKIKPYYSDEEIVIPDEVFKVKEEPVISKDLEEEPVIEETYEEIETLPLYSIGSFSLDEIRMIVSNDLNNLSDDELYKYVLENVTKIKTEASEEVKDFTTDQILEVFFMMSDFMNEDETLNIKEGVEYIKENNIYDKDFTLNINGFNFSNTQKINSLLENNFTVKDDENFANKEINVFNETFVNLLDTKKNNIYIFLDKNENKDLKDFDILTLAASLNIENTINGNISIEDVNLGDNLKDIENKLGQPFEKYKNNTSIVSIYKNNTTKVSLVFKDNILTKIFIKAAKEDSDFKNF